MITLPGRAVLALVCGAAAIAPAAGAEPDAAPAFKDKACLKCHDDKDAQGEFQDKTTLSLYVDADRLARSAHGLQKIACATCHATIRDLDEHSDPHLTGRPEFRRAMAGLCVSCHPEAAAHYQDDLHSRATPDALLCMDCHDAHGDLSLKVSRAGILTACARCHREVSERYARSAHGAALLGKDNPDVPVCSDCHRAHAVRKSSTVDFHVSSVDLCERCHGDAAKMNKYGLSTAVMQTYLQDFHGVSLRYSRKAGGVSGGVTATCVDCHGAHDIPRKDSPDSLTMKANVAKACRKCHPDATEQFTGAWLSHYIPSLSRAPLVYLARLFYWAFIPFMIAGLVLLIVVDFIHLVRRREAPAHPASGRTYVRFGAYRRAEHLVVMVTFTLLVVTGLPQKFNDQGWAEWVIGALGGLDTARLIHRVAGFAFAGLAFVHVALNLVWLLRGRVFGDMLLQPKDFRDTIASLQLAFGLPAEKPRFGRYEFRQKFEYWGMVLGGMVMVGTGFVLFWPVLFARVLPGELIAVAKVAHSFEAMMALLVIVIWHLYCSHLRPGFFPLDPSIFTGKIPVERLEEEHPLEHERLRQAQARGAAGPPGA